MAHCKVTFCLDNVVVVVALVVFVVVVVGGGGVVVVGGGGVVGVFVTIFFPSRFMILIVFVF